MIVVQSRPMRPKWANRQLIDAADLTAEQVWQDSQIARLRRFTLGWGVVTGLQGQLASDTLVIQPGYGMTPTGHEVYLAEAIEVSKLHQRVIKACCPQWGENCDLPTDEEEVTEDDADSKTAWIVLRPESYEACPRAGVAVGCEHPGNQLIMSRQGTALSIELVCDLDPGLLVPESDCSTLQALLQGGDIPMPDELESILPILSVTVNRDQVISVSSATRQRMLPMSLLQGVLACCDCGDGEPEEPDVDIWSDPASQSLGVLVADFQGFVPGGASDLALSVKSIFKRGRLGLPGLPGFSKKQLILQPLAAAGLVSSKGDVNNWKNGQYVKIYEDALAAAGSGRTPIGNPRNPRPDPRRASLGNVVNTKQSNFRQAVIKLNNPAVLDFIAMDDAAYLDQTTELGSGVAVASAWMTERLKVIIKR